MGRQRWTVGARARRWFCAAMVVASLAVPRTADAIVDGLTATLARLFVPVVAEVCSSDSADELNTGLGTSGAGVRAATDETGVRNYEGGYRGPTRKSAPGTRASKRIGHYVFTHRNAVSGDLAVTANVTYPRIVFGGVVPIWARIDFGDPADNAFVVCKIGFETSFDVGIRVDVHPAGADAESPLLPGDGKVVVPAVPSPTRRSLDVRLSLVGDDLILDTADPNITPRVWDRRATLTGAAAAFAGQARRGSGVVTVKYDGDYASSRGFSINGALHPAVAPVLSRCGDAATAGVAAIPAATTGEAQSDAAAAAASCRTAATELAGVSAAQLRGEGVSASRVAAALKKAAAGFDKAAAAYGAGSDPKGDALARAGLKALVAAGISARALPARQGKPFARIAAGLR